jgi:hypothetical protein
MPLQAGKELANRGMQLFGAGFIVTPEEAQKLGLGRSEGLERHIRPYRNGRDLAQSPRGVLAIDLFGLALEEVKSRFPEVYQWLLERVKPERDQNNRASYRDNWWIFGEPRKVMRRALAVTDPLHRHRGDGQAPGLRLPRYGDPPDNKLIVIASADAFHLASFPAGSMWSGPWRRAVAWASAMIPFTTRPVCFEPFPFPACDEAQTALIRKRAEALDAHRKRQQALHPGLGLTDMYNVLEKLRAGRH